MKIFLTRRHGDWHASVDGLTGIWGSGKSQTSALGDLVCAHYETFGTKVSVRPFDTNEFIAEFEGQPQFFEAGSSPHEAAGKLLRSHMARFNVDEIVHGSDTWTKRYLNGDPLTR